MNIVHERDVKELRLPGSCVKRLISPENSDVRNLSVSIIRILAGQALHPACSHFEEEVIYVIRGRAKVTIDEEVAEVTAGMVTFFPSGSVHVLENVGEEELKVICCFAPASDIT